MVKFGTNNPLLDAPQTPLFEDIGRQFLTWSRQWDVAASRFSFPYYSSIHSSTLVGRRLGWLERDLNTESFQSAPNSQQPSNYAVRARLLQLPSGKINLFNFSFKGVMVMEVGK